MSEAVKPTAEQAEYPVRMKVSGDGYVGVLRFRTEEDRDRWIEARIEAAR